MDFYDVLERVLALLQQHKRVTYRALQRQFDLDEAYLEDLKAEIIEARQLAVDEGGRVLVWTGAAGTGSVGCASATGSASAIRPGRFPSPRRSFSNLSWHLGGRTPAAHGAVLRSGGLDYARQATRPGRLPRGRARLSSHLRRRDPAL